MVTSLERSLQAVYCSFGRGYQTHHSTGRRDFLPIYTAERIGAMIVRFLAKGKNSNSNSAPVSGVCDLQAPLTKYIF